MTLLKHECPSCLDDFEVHEMATLSCSHIYCKRCFSDYLKLQIKEGVSSVPCLGYKCNRLVDEPLIASLVDQDVYSKYVRFGSQSYVEKNPHLKWCPAKGCDSALKKYGQIAGMVMCRCGHVWCFKCQRDGHWPTTCEQYKWWTDIYAKDESKISFDSEEEAQSVRWLLKYTQDCPRCGSPIEKNGGCNHMSCKKCGHQYCWVCQEKWESSHYACSQHSSADDNSRESIARRVEGNLTFRQYYLINVKARRGADAVLRTKAVQLMESLVKDYSRVTPKDIENISAGVEYVFLSRHIIIHVCIMGKYMQDHKIGGSKPLKNEIKRLASGISYLDSCIPVDEPLKKINLRNVEYGLQTMKTYLKEFMIEFTKIWRAHLKDHKHVASAAANEKK
jgi:ariadne-1